MYLNLHLLRIFMTVVAEQSFTRAAAVLHISQPAVSKAVRELQLQLQLPLMEQGGRGAKGVSLTESGKALYDHARGIFALERAALEDVRARVGLQRGQVAIGASTTVASYWLPTFVAQLRLLHPGIEVRMEVANTSRIAQALIDCRVDVALVEGVVDDPRIESSHWRDEELCIVAHPQSRLALKKRLELQDLKDELWLVRELGSGTREVGDKFRSAHALLPKQTMEIGSNEGIARTLAAGIGVAMLPVRVVQELLQLKALTALAPSKMPRLHRPLFRLSLKARPVSPQVQAFTRILDAPSLLES
jgi:LysR family transcriptional regulator, transcriptional activator of the cysJI operon